MSEPASPVCVECGKGCVDCWSVTDAGPICLDCDAKEDRAYWERQKADQSDGDE